MHPHRNENVHFVIDFFQLYTRCLFGTSKAPETSYGEKKRADLLSGLRCDVVKFHSLIFGLNQYLDQCS